MNIFNAVSVHSQWLQGKLAVAARNIANSDTPEFKAQQINNFELQPAQDAFKLALTAAGHMQIQENAATGDFGTTPQNNLDVSHSGNDVMLEKELSSVGEASRGMAFDSGLAKLFHRMILTSVKG